MVTDDPDRAAGQVAGERTDGLSFEPPMNCSARLRDLGAVVSFCDPHVPASEDVPTAGDRVPFSGAVLAGADIVLFLVDHPEFTADVVAKHSRLVLDTKGVMRETSFHGELL